MRDIFPKNVSDENDDKVCDFWFSEDFWHLVILMRGWSHVFTIKG
jgi:hypothetical protein